VHGGASTYKQAISSFKEFHDVFQKKKCWHLLETLFIQLHYRSLRRGLTIIWFNLQFGVEQAFGNEELQQKYISTTLCDIQSLLLINQYFFLRKNMVFYTWALITSNWTRLWLKKKYCPDYIDLFFIKSSKPKFILKLTFNKLIV